jgi:hypothetical protein
VEHEGVGLLGGHPHRTPGPVRLEVALIDAPEIHGRVAREPAEFF